MGCSAGDGVYADIVSQLLHLFQCRVFLLLLLFVCLFSHSPNVWELLIWFWFSFRVSFSVCDCGFSVSTGGGKFRILLCCHLELELPCFSFFRFNWKYCSGSSIEERHLCYIFPEPFCLNGRNFGIFVT